MREESKEEAGLHERLGVVFHSNLKVLKDNRRFLGALFRCSADPQLPLSVFGKGTQMQRAQSMAIFRDAIAKTSISEEAQQLLPAALWLVHLGMILYFIYDESSDQRKTHKLLDG